MKTSYQAYSLINQLCCMLFFFAGIEAGLELNRNNCYLRLPETDDKKTKL